MNDPRYQADLTSFAALLGDSFSSKVDLLAKIVQGAHYPSIGLYKERLLTKFISDYLPRNFAVGTGFVLFPSEKDNVDNARSQYKRTNKSAYTLSKQCDVIIYDAAKYPLVFKDEDFVIVRPEAVKTVIEVKGNLKGKELKTTLENIFDFEKKWSNWKHFYEIESAEILTPPRMFLMAWDSKNTGGGKAISGKGIREKIVSMYKEQYQQIGHNFHFPFLNGAYLYDDCRVIFGGDGGYKKPGELRAGWHTEHGQFLRKIDGNYVRQSDRTLASLLSQIHISIDPEFETFNRFLSYFDELEEYDSNEKPIQPHKHTGFSPWIVEKSSQ